MKFRKKSVVIDAYRWYPGTKSDIVIECEMRTGYECGLYGQEMKEYVTYDGPIGMIKTLEGNMYGLPGSWVITGVMGEHYFVRDDIFKLTYEEIT